MKERKKGEEVGKRVMRWGRVGVGEGVSFLVIYTLLSAHCKLNFQLYH